MAQPVNPANAVRQYGWVPDLPDFRDYPYSQISTNKRLPSTDLRGFCPPIVDQGPYNSCMTNALAAAVAFDLIKAGNPPVPMSRFFLYYNCRAVQGNVSSDAGTSMRVGCQSLVNHGICPETEWPYTPAKFAVAPSPSCNADGLVHRIVSYFRLSTLADMLDCLAQGFPFVNGLIVYSSFRAPAGGVVPMPLATDQRLGGHGVMIVGNIESDQLFIGRNSYGMGWGNAGYFTIPYAYLTNPGLAGDFWTIRR